MIKTTGEKERAEKRPEGGQRERECARTTKRIRRDRREEVVRLYLDTEGGQRERRETNGRLVDAVPEWYRSRPIGTVDLLRCLVPFIDQPGQEEAFGTVAQDREILVDPVPSSRLGPLARALLSRLSSSSSPSSSPSRRMEIGRAHV